MMKEKIDIRVATQTDAEQLLEIYAPYVERTAITFEYDIPSVEEFADRIKNIKSKYPYILAQVDGRVVGYAYASSFKGRAAYDWAVETSIYVKMDCKRSGIGSSLYEGLEKYLKLQGILNMNACIACPQEDDEYLTRDSIDFHEKMGYRLVGEFNKCGYKFDRWYNMAWMEKHIGEHTNHQSKIKTFGEVLNEI